MAEVTILYLRTRFKEKVSFITYHDPLNPIKSKWKVPASQRPPRTQNWFDDAENLSTAALHKIIVGTKFQPLSNENKITRLGAARPGAPNLYYRRHKANNVPIQYKSLHYLHERQT